MGQLSIFCDDFFIVDATGHALTVLSYRLDANVFVQTQDLSLEGNLSKPLLSTKSWQQIVGMPVPTCKSSPVITLRSCISHVAEIRKMYSDSVKGGSHHHLKLGFPEDNTSCTW
jgi:hypothetical protein